MKQYLVQAIKLDKKDKTISDSLGLFRYDNVMQAIEWASSVADDASVINGQLMGYDFITVHECDVEFGDVTIYNPIASFKIK